MALVRPNRRRKHSFSDIVEEWNKVAADTRAAVNELNYTRAEFLLTDAKLGLTLLNLARTRHDPLAGRLTLSHAREALDMVDRHLTKLRSQLDPRQRDAIQEVRDELESWVAV